MPNPAHPSPVTPPPELSWSGLTHVGRVRTNNEDTFLALTFDGHNVHYHDSFAYFNGDAGFYVGESPEANVEIEGNHTYANQAEGILFRDSQGGYGDLALAAWAYEEARRRGLGHEISTE